MAAAKLFEKFFAKPHRITNEPHQPVSFDGRGCWWHDPEAIPLAAGRGFNIPLVGELQWQDNISAVVGGRCEEGITAMSQLNLLPGMNPVIRIP